MGTLSPDAARLFPLRPQRAPLMGLSNSLDRNWGPVCSVGGGGFSGAEFAPFPSPHHPRLPTSSGDGPALLWSISVPLSCEPPAVCSRRLIFPCYPTVLKKLPPTALRAFGPGPYPKQCRRLLSVPPPLAGGGCGRLGYFSAGSCF